MSSRLTRRSFFALPVALPVAAVAAKVEAVVPARAPLTLTIDTSALRSVLADLELQLIREITKQRRLASALLAFKKSRSLEGHSSDSASPEPVVPAGNDGRSGERDASSPSQVDPPGRA